jgi:threonine dehydrogenase-like Zn-dependent dehydrogenase
LTVIPKQSGSARLEDVPEPPVEDGPVLVEVMAVGICGTDLEIVNGDYGWAPPGRDRLILGHESLGRVVEASGDSGFSKGDLVVGIVRRPDPVPCRNCSVGEWDMCRNGKYTERGIKEIDGYCSERYRIEPAFAVKVDSKLGLLGVLLEPTSVVAKAWEQVERIGHRAEWSPRRVLVTGAGPVGLLAALLGVQRGLEVHVLDRATDGPKPTLVRDLGATYHSDGLEKMSEHADIILECTGAGQLIFDVMAHSTPDRIACLAGVCSGGRKLEVDPKSINNSMVLGNGVVFGSVNANRRHYEAAVAALAKADPGWLARLITRKVPIEQWREALERRPGDVKTVITLRE